VNALTEAAAFHGLAQNAALPPGERLACAVKALDLYEAAVTRVQILIEEGPHLVRWIDGSKLVDLRELEVALSGQPVIRASGGGPVQVAGDCPPIGGVSG
jgi:hypothetical protein